MPESVALCSIDELAPGEARRFDVAGRRIALVRIGDEFHAVDDECSHEDYSLSEGEVYDHTVGPKYIGGAVPTPADIPDGFHTFSLLWTNTSVTWYIDGSSVSVLPLVSTYTIELTDCSGGRGSRISPLSSTPQGVPRSSHARQASAVSP